MNRISQSFLLMLVFICNVLPCEAQVVQSRNESPPSPANNYSTQRWQEYVSPDDKFKVSFPGQPKEESDLTDTPNGKKIQTHKVSYSSLIFYGVQYMDWPWLMSEPDKFKDLVNMERSRVLRFAAVENWRPLVSEADITVEGHPGKVFQAEAEEKILRVKFFVVDNRTYTMLVVAPKGHDDAIEGKNAYEKLAMSFLDSFKLHATSSKAK